MFDSFYATYVRLVFPLFAAKFSLAIYVGLEGIMYHVLHCLVMIGGVYQLRLGRVTFTAHTALFYTIPHSVSF